MFIFKYPYECHDEESNKKDLFKNTLGLLQATNFTKPRLKLAEVCFIFILSSKPTSPSAGTRRETRISPGLGNMFSRAILGQ